MAVATGLLIVDVLDDAARLKQTRQGIKNFVMALAIAAVAVSLRPGSGTPPPYDDIYHAKRIAFSASHAFRSLTFDADRGESGAFCPWPPLYDLFGAAMLRAFGGVNLLPPFFFALFAGAVSLALSRSGWLAALTGGFTLALSPYLIGVSRPGHIDHHFVEPLLVLLIVGATATRRRLALGIAIAAALFVQTALLLAAGIAFLDLFFFERQSGVPGAHRMVGSNKAWPRFFARWRASAAYRMARTKGNPMDAIPFATAALFVGAWRLSMPSGYPDGPWFLGWAHVSLLTAAAVACAMRGVASNTTALASGAAVALAFPSTADAIVAGSRFFGGDPWLATIVEFQPMFRAPSQIGTDIANLTGGAILALTLCRRHRTLALFSTVYLAAALSNRRFLVPAIPLFAVAGAIAASDWWQSRPRHARSHLSRRQLAALCAAAATLVPPLVYDTYSGVARSAVALDGQLQSLGDELHPLPRGRVLAPWSFGHAIDVIGEKPVLIDNFGSMPDRIVFGNATDALVTTHTESLLAYCRSRDVRYLALPDPARYLAAAAASAGVPSELYRRTRLARRTVWWRLYRGEQIGGFRPIGSGAIRIWQID